MNSAHPLRSDSAGCTTSSHSSGLIWATSSITTPSSRKPRRESALSPPKMRITTPLPGKRIHSSVSLTSTPGILQA